MARRFYHAIQQLPRSTARHAPNGTTSHSSSAMKESHFQSQVIMLAKLHGWLVMHTRAVEIRPGVWKTPLTGHPGYPDLTLVHSTRGVIFAELKSSIGKLSASQEIWFGKLSEAGMEVHVWRPNDIEFISKRLANRKPDND